MKAICADNELHAGKYTVRQSRQMQQIEEIQGSARIQEALKSYRGEILLLVTCEEKDEERRVVAARRIRENETVEALRAAVVQNP